MNRHRPIGTNATPDGWGGVRGHGVGNSKVIQLVPLDDIFQQTS